MKKEGVKMKLRIKVIITCLILLMGCFALSGCGEKEQDPAQLVGGFTENRDVTDDDMAIFKEALSADEVAKYVPKAVATQVVSGTNYRFHCAVIEDNDETGNFVDITIYDSLNADEAPEIIEIADSPSAK